MKTNKEKYKQLCQNDETIPFYSQPFWLDAVCGADAWDVDLYEKNGRILGALPYYIKQKFGLRIITQPPFTQYNGIWLATYPSANESKRLSYEKEIMTAIIDQLETKKVHFYQQCFSPSITNWLPFYWNGYRQTTRYTYRINDITDAEAVFEGFQRNKKQNYRKCEKEGFQVKFDLSPNDFYEFHREVLNQQGKTISYGEDLLQRMYRAAYDNHAGRVSFIETASGKLICALFNVWDRNSAYHLIAALAPAYRNTGILDYLVFFAIRYFSERRIRIYDFEGSMISEVEQSFRHFGAIQTPYFQISKIISQSSFIRSALQYKLGGMT